MQFGEFFQNIRHFIAAFAAADVYDDVGIRPFGKLMLNDGFVKLTGEVYLNTNMHRLVADGREILLKALEYKLLYYLFTNRGRVVSKDDLLRDVWEDEHINEGTIAVHIRHLREKIEADPREPQLIKTVWGVGYLMEETEV